MQNQVINKADYQRYFDDISKKIKSQRIEIEVLGLNIGDQIEAESVLLEGLSYDPNDQTFYVHTPKLDHAVTHPKKIVAVLEDSSLSSFAIDDEEGQTHMVKFRKPLSLKTQ